MTNLNAIVIGDTLKFLNDRIEAFLDLNDMKADGSNFGWLVNRDTTMVSRLRLGGDITTRKMEAVLAFMQNPIRFDGKRLPLKPLTIKRSNLP